MGDVAGLAYTAITLGVLRGLSLSHTKYESQAENRRRRTLISSSVTGATGPESLAGERPEDQNKHSSFRTSVVDDVGFGGPHEYVYCDPPARLCSSRWCSHGLLSSQHDPVATKNTSLLSTSQPVIPRLDTSPGSGISPQASLTSSTNWASLNPADVHRHLEPYLGIDDSRPASPKRLQVSTPALPLAAVRVPTELPADHPVSLGIVTESEAKMMCRLSVHQLFFALRRMLIPFPAS